MRHPFLLLVLALSLSGCDTPTSYQLTPEEEMARLTEGFESTTAYTAQRLDSIQIDELLRSGNVHVSDTAAIWGFYRRRDMQYAWFVDDTLTNAAWNFLNLFQTMDIEPRDTAGVLGRLQRQVEDLLLSEPRGADLAPADRAAVEMKLTTQFFQFADREYSGVVKRDLKELDWYIPRRKKIYEALIDSLVAGRQDLSLLEPVHPQYRLLKKELRRYKALAELKDSVIIPFDEDLRLVIGDTSQVLLAIKERLFELGDLPSLDTTNTIDSTLIQALQHFRSRLGLEPQEWIDEAVIAELQRPVRHRVRQIMINMERTRWLPQEQPADMILVNIPEYKLHVFENGDDVWDMRVVVGQVATRTSIFAGDMDRIVFSPYWNIPKSIVGGEILPALRKDPSYLRRKGMEVVRGGTPVDASDIDWNKASSSIQIRQRPGGGNALGRVKFLFPNQYSIYLHDTPSKSKFEANDRAFSHGCIRLSEPERLAVYMLRNDTAWTAKKVNEAMHSGKEKTVMLKSKMPVVIAYLTAWVDAKGNMNFRNDVYGHDERLANEIFGETQKTPLITVQ